MDDLMVVLDDSLSVRRHVEMHGADSRRQMRLLPGEVKVIGLVCGCASPADTPDFVRGRSGDRSGIVVLDGTVHWPVQREGCVTSSRRPALVRKGDRIAHS